MSKLLVQVFEIWFVELILNVPFTLGIKIYIVIIDRMNLLGSNQIEEAPYSCGFLGIFAGKMSCTFLKSTDLPKFIFPIYWSKIKCGGGNVYGWNDWEKWLRKQNFLIIWTIRSSNIRLVNMLLSTSTTESVQIHNSQMHFP